MLLEVELETHLGDLEREELLNPIHATFKQLERHGVATGDWVTWRKMYASCWFHNFDSLEINERQNLDVPVFCSYTIKECI